MLISALISPDLRPNSPLTAMLSPSTSLPRSFTTLRREHMIVVRERYPPLLLGRAMQVMRLLFHRAQRIEIVGLIPRPAHMRAGRHDIRQMHERIAAVAHDRHLMIIRMAAGDGCRHAGDDLGVADDRLDRGLGRREDLMHMAIGGAQPLIVRIARGLQFAFLYDQLRLREMRA